MVIMLPSAALSLASVLSLAMLSLADALADWVGLEAPEVQAAAISSSDPSPAATPSLRRVLSESVMPVPFRMRAENRAPPAAPSRLRDERPFLEYVTRYVTGFRLLGI
jgi:hypothetical protein